MICKQIMIHKVKARFAGNTLLLLFSLVLILFCSSCDLNNQSIKDINYFKGTRGIEMTFLQNSPPEEIYEDSRFPISLSVENLGATDVLEEKYGFLSISYDPYYVEAVDLKTDDNVVITKNGILLKGVQLPGKSQFYPTGYETFLSFLNFKTKKIEGQREMPDTQIFASICYPYTTHFSSLVCVDLNTYGENLRKQTCKQADITASDQGAPVAVTLVEVENQPAGNDLVKPIFTIHIQNKGSGTVLSPFSNPLDLDRACAFKETYGEDFNTVTITATLSESKELECTPNPIKLYNNEALVRCQVKEEELLLGHQNYEAPLTINLSYVYLSSVSKDISIKRINPYAGITEDNGQNTSFPYETQPGISRCDYCAEHAEAAECQPQNLKYTINFQKGFSCQCSYKSCSDLYPSGLCVPFSNFCPGATYCCMPSCKSNEIRGTDGECYSKCSSCSATATAKTCACGSGTDVSGYSLVEKGKFCCTKNKSSHDTQDECKQACTTTTENTQ